MKSFLDILEVVSSDSDASSEEAMRHEVVQTGNFHRESSWQADVHDDRGHGHQDQDESHQGK